MQKYPLLNILNISKLGGNWSTLTSNPVPETLLPNPSDPHPTSTASVPPLPPPPVPNPATPDAPVPASAPPVLHPTPVLTHPNPSAQGETVSMIEITTQNDIHDQNSSESLNQSEANNVANRSINAVQTRAGSKIKSVHPLIVPDIPTLDLTPAQFSELQNKCPSLSNVRNKVTSNEIETTREGAEYKYEIENNLIYRTCLKSKIDSRIGNKALVAPQECRQMILTVAHESAMVGHYSQRKTNEKVRDIFFWPGMGRDIALFCRSCDKCQRMSAKGRVKPAPLIPLPVITEPFARCAIDIVGEVKPASDRGHRYILTLIDYATGYPEALPLKETNSMAVAEALIEMFSRIGIPREILSDRGSNFTSQLMAEVHRLLSVKPLFTSPWHPACNGRIERLHSTLKSCLRKLCSDRPKDWDRYLAPTLFAIREMPSDRTGFSPFELLYGRTVRGPLSVLKDLWADTTINDEQRTVFQYVLDLRDKLEECAKIAKENATISSKKYKTYFDVKSQNRKFKVGDEVLVLLPDKVNKLLISWAGPYKVVECRDKVNYIIDKNGTKKLFHVNMLKQYFRRNPTYSSGVDENVDVVLTIIHPFQNVHMAEDESVAPVCLAMTPQGRMDALSHVTSRTAAAAAV